MAPCIRPKQPYGIIYKTLSCQGRGRSSTMGSLLIASCRTHPIDEQVRQFYRRWGFDDVPFDPKRSMIVRMVDLEKSGLVSSPGAPATQAWHEHAYRARKWFSMSGGRISFRNEEHATDWSKKIFRQWFSRRGASLRTTDQRSGAQLRSNGVTHKWASQRASQSGVAAGHDP